RGRTVTARARGGSGISLPALRPAREVHRWTGTGQHGVTPVMTKSPEAWPELRLWDEKSLRQEPWWNADRRAAPKRAEPHPMVRWKVTQRLSAFRFLFSS